MNRSILIADDDPIIRTLLRTHLAARGFQCLVATSGDEALEILIEARVGVLLTDLDMPGMSGLELLSEVRVRGMFTRCVVITGYTTIGNLTACIREGAIGLVPKPIVDLSIIDAEVDDAFAQVERWTERMTTIMRLRHAGAEGSHAG